MWETLSAHPSPKPYALPWQNLVQILDPSSPLSPVHSFISLSSNGSSKINNTVRLSVSNKMSSDVPPNDTSWKLDKQVGFLSSAGPDSGVWTWMRGNWEGKPWWEKWRISRIGYHKNAWQRVGEGTAIMITHHHTSVRSSYLGSIPSSAFTGCVTLGECRLLNLSGSPFFHLWSVNW